MLTPEMRTQIGNAILGRGVVAAEREVSALIERMFTEALTTGPLPEGWERREVVTPAGPTESVLPVAVDDGSPYPDIQCGGCGCSVTLRSCREQWEDCLPDEYHPSCCRFPKSCSCTHGSPNPDDYEPCHMCNLRVTESEKRRTVIEGPWEVAE